MTVSLTVVERGMMEGARGPGTAMAMRVLADAASMLGAKRLVEISSAHIDGCLHHGDGGVEFAERLARGSDGVAVPTTLNVGALDLLQREHVKSDAARADMARRQMDAYVGLGAEPTFTCAPYQIGHLPRRGEQVAWGESNAIAFVNSVLGARTERYGDFLDACCAVTGRAPLYGLHLDENRAAQVVVDLSRIPPEVVASDTFYPVLGTWLGLELGHEVVALAGIPTTVVRDQLKALGAAAASTGAVALFHVVGVTPEAPTLEAACRRPPAELPTVGPTLADLVPALDRLTTAADAEAIDAVAVGSPHFSFDEFRELVRLLAGRRLKLPFFACTARATMAELADGPWLDELRGSGVSVVADTCVVVAPILPEAGRVLMTNSGKFAHYAPSQTGYEVVFGSLAECVESAIAGTVVRDLSSWGG